MLWVSAAAHALVVAALLLGPRLDSRPLIATSVVTVDLVAAPPAPTPTPAPRPQPPAPARPSRIVLPDRPTRVAPEAVPTPAVAPRPEPVEESYEDLLARLREGAGEDRPQPVEVTRRAPAPPAPPRSEPLPAARPAPAVAPTGGRGVLASPEVVGWVRDARIHVRRQWVLSAGFRLQALETHVSVELDGEGNVLGEPTITKRSGNPWYDESVVRAIQKADPLPAPPEAGKWPFVFRPEDY